MDFQEVLMLASAERDSALLPVPRGVEWACYRVPDYPYVGSGAVWLYAIHDEDQLMFIDCGPFQMTDKAWFSRTIDQFAESADQASLFLTHCHCDHVGEVAWFAEQGLTARVNAAVEASGRLDYDICALAFGTSRYDLPFGVAEYCQNQVQLWESVEKVAETVDNWDLLNVGNRRFEVMPLPGHDAGQSGLISKDKTLLFSGDCLCRNPSIFSWRLDAHDGAAAMETWSGLLAYPLEWVATAHDGFFEGEDEIKTLVRDQIGGVDAKAKDILQGLRGTRGYMTACDFAVESVGVTGLIETSQQARYLNALRLGQYFAYFEFLYDYEKVHRSFDDDGCAVYEPARSVSFFA